MSELIQSPPTCNSVDKPELSKVELAKQAAIKAYTERTSFTFKEYKENKKQLDDYAKRLPPVFDTTIKVTRKIVTGFSYINRGIEYIDGKKVIPTQNYEEVTQQPLHVLRNHSNSIKRAFMNGGVRGVNDYILGLSAYIAIEKAKYPERYKHLTLKSDIKEEKKGGIKKWFRL